MLFYTSQHGGLGRWALIERRTGLRKGVDAGV